MSTQARPRQTPAGEAGGYRCPAGGAAADGRRAVRAQGRQTAHRLLAAGLTEFTQRGFAAVTVDDIARRADTSHGAFYLYFANKDDLFAALARDALAAMSALADRFPVVTGNQAGKAALHEWVGAFCGIYQAHATVLRTLSHADLVGEAVWADGTRALFRMADTIATGMTAARDGLGPHGTWVPARSARLDAVALLMMLERVNYLLSQDLLARDEMVDRLTDIIMAAFRLWE